MSQVKVLLVQLASFGDCLLVTPIAKQIKEIDYPGCHLSWMIGSKYSSVLKNNPYVDEIIEIPLETIEDIQKQRDLITTHVSKIGGNEKYNKIFVTDYTKENYQNWYGTTRSSLFRSYPHKLIIDPQPIIYLDTQEKKNVAEFCYKNNINNETFNVLFECSPQSGQSLMNFAKAKEIAEQITIKNKIIKFILSSNQSFISDNPNIIDGSKISFRENAELINHCHLLVGCSSGISWLCTSNYSKKNPYIQLINPDYTRGGGFSASIKLDFRYFGIETNYLIELYDQQVNILEKCILESSKNNFGKARKKYDVVDNRVFSELRFLKESKIKIHEKYLLYLWCCSGNDLKNIFIKLYKNFKPKWFTPKVWIHKLR